MRLAGKRNSCGRVVLATSLVATTACAGSEAGDEAGFGDNTSRGIEDGGSHGTRASDTEDEAASSSSEAPTTSGASTGETKFDLGSPSTTGDDPSCNPDLIPDTLAFSFVDSYDLQIDTLQAGVYDSTRDQVVVFSFYGEGRILDTDGTITDTIEAPPEALPSLDGGAYDLASDLILLVNQDCDLVEVDPETFAANTVIPLGQQHGVSVCAGLAIDPMSNLYLTSYGTDELVVLDRSGQNELFRVDMAAIGMTGFDGIAEIAGSENFLVNSTTQQTAAIIAADGTLVAGPGAVGDMPIMGGGEVGQPDSMLTICRNGHTWVCDAYETTCSDFAPSDGDKTACGCLIAG